LKKLLFRFWKRDSLRKFHWIEKYIQNNDNIMDLGCGPGWITSFLRKKGFTVTPVDIEDLSIIDEIKPIIFNGEQLPFKDKEFDLTLLLTVLHHVKDPIDLIRETKRISKRIIIIEDIHSNGLQKLMVMFLDSIMNLEFRGHPHNNLSDRDWKNLFQQEELRLIDFHHHRIAWIFKQSVYILIPIDTPDA